MNARLMLKVMLVLLTSVALTSCTASRPSLLDAAGVAGVAAARSVSVDIGPLPAECYRKTPHAATPLGTDVRVILRRERAQLDAANRGKADCVAVHDAKRANLRRKAND